MKKVAEAMRGATIAPIEIQTMWGLAGANARSIIMGLAPPTLGAPALGNGGASPSGAADIGEATIRIPGCDAEDRPYDFVSIVVNFANVGATYGTRVLGRDKNSQQVPIPADIRRMCVSTQEFHPSYREIYR